VTDLACVTVQTVLYWGFEKSFAFAARLRNANIPFIFASGYGEPKISGESRISELVVSKPYDIESLGTAIGLTVARQG
jgi:hypothetical protein